MKIIPRAAWYVATILCVVLPLVAGLLLAVMVSSSEGFHPPFPLLFVGILIAATMYVYILLLGYIAADAKRRGMRVVLWVLLAIFVPNAIGIILYFILRDPLLRKCPACGVSSGPSYAFCPSCG